MRNVIAGTDFSIASVNACRYAAMLAKQIGGKLTLFNLYDAPVVHENAELEKFEHDKNEKQMEKLLAKLVDDFPDVNINYKLTHGAFIDELSELVKSTGHSILVFGLAPKSWFQRFVYGSHSTALAGKVNTPVIIVPSSYRDHRLKKAIVAVDAKSDIYNAPLKTFSRLLESTNVKLMAVHVTGSDGKANLPEKTISINEKSFRINVVPSRSIEKGLNHFTEENNIDLITVLSKSHPVLENVFSESVTKRVAYTAKVPVLAIHI